MDNLQMKKTAPFMFYVLYYAAISFSMPFIILYFQDLGFSGAQIGLLTGMAPLITLVGAPLWTGLADAKGKHKLVMSITILAAVVFSSLFPFFKTIIPILLLVFVYSLFSAPINSFADSATMTMLAGEKAMYGRVRIGGTIGWGLMAPLAGFIIQSYGLKWIFWGYAGIMMLTLFVSQKFTFGSNLTDAPVHWDVRKVLRNRNWAYFLILGFIGGIAFTSVNSYLAPYMKELGANQSTVGIALTISTLGELPVLFFANRLLKRFGAYSLLKMGMIVTGIRLLLYAWFNFPMGILVFQLLNGMTYPLVWVAGVSYADENSLPGMKATAQGLWGAMVFGFGASAGGLISGLMLGSIGGQWMYLIIGCFVLAGVGIITLIDRAAGARPAKGLI
jgi:PPP family 3-phenylpropionic acid transporter